MNISKRFGVAKATNVKRLLTVLANTKLAAGKAEGVSWQSLYQTLFGLINNVGDNEDKTNAAITSIQNTISGGGSGGGGTGLLGASYATINPETLLPNSRQLIAGANVTFTDNGTTLQISSTGSAIDHDHVPMSTGAEPLEIMSNGAGQVLLIGFTE